MMGVMGGGHNRLNMPNRLGGVMAGCFDLFTLFIYFIYFDTMIKYKISSVKSPKSGLKVYFPSIVQVAHLSFDDVVTAVEKECTLTRADVRGALSALEYVVLKELKQGNTVRLGGVGSFRLTIVSKNGEDDAANVSARNIARVRTHFTPSGAMSAALQGSEINAVVQ